ncbi:MAG: hypothetical protein E7638_08240 [Ruminococcaceae bacterium]|nr:hypothetical protein [Oscillospiraceae bacterium]
MKPTSIISLIVAVLFIIVGLTTCIIAQNMANASGEPLFAEEVGDGIVKSVDLGEVDISKIVLDVSEAEINIFGNSETSYAEFVNFRENYYTLSTANKTLTFNEITDFVSMLKFWENGFSFKGMRHIIRFSEDTDSKKIINIHLTADHPIKIFEVEADCGTVSLESMTSGSDYTLNIEKGEVKADTLSTTSAFKLNGTELTLTMGKAEVGTMEIKAENLNMKVDSFLTAGSALIETAGGSVTVVSAADMSSMNIDLDTLSGKLTVNGVEMDTHYKPEKNPELTSSVRIIADSADISFSQSPVNGNAPETTAETTPETPETAE